MPRAPLPPPWAGLGLLLTPAGGEGVAAALGEAGGLGLLGLGLLGLGLLGLGLLGLGLLGGGLAALLAAAGLGLLPPVLMAGEGEVVVAAGEGDAVVAALGEGEAAAGLGEGEDVAGEGEGDAPAGLGEGEPVQNRQHLCSTPQRVAADAALSSPFKGSL